MVLRATEQGVELGPYLFRAYGELEQAMGGDLSFDPRSWHPVQQSNLEHLKGEGV